MRRTAPKIVLLAALGALLFAAPASADWFTPQDGGSPNADSIDSLYKLIAILGLVVFVSVEGALLWAFFKFKAKRGAVAAQIHGNTRLEIAWTVIPVLILLFIITFTFIKLPDIKNPKASGPNGLALATNPLYASTDQPAPPGKALTIKVDGQQYVWRFQYPDPKVFAYEEMVVPADTTVILEISSDDVAHSWWIPKLGGKMDAVPGYINKTWFRAREGVYRGQCAELCGRNHANMYARVRAIPADEYEAWVAERKKDIQSAQDQQAEQRKTYEQPNVPDAAEGEDVGDTTRQGNNPE